jgi:hypothetical protein
MAELSARWAAAEHHRERIQGVCNETAYARVRKRKYGQQHEGPAKAERRRRCHPTVSGE